MLKTIVCVIPFPFVLFFSLKDLHTILLYFHFHTTIARMILNESPENRDIRRELIKLGFICCCVCRIYFLY